MGPNTRIYDRFTGYSTEDCDCIYCLYWRGIKRGCSLDVCCCLEEKEAAQKRESEAEAASLVPKCAIAV